MLDIPNWKAYALAMTKKNKLRFGVNASYFMSRLVLVRPDIIVAPKPDKSILVGWGSPKALCTAWHVAHS